MRKQRIQSIVVHLFWLLLSVYICWGAVGLALGTFTQPGPGLMPFLAGSLMFVLVVIDFIDSLKTGKEASLPRGKKLLLLAMTIVSLWIYAVLLFYIGFLLDTLLLLFFLFAVIQKVKWTTSLIAAVLAVTISYALFSFLGTEFPQGIFFE